MLQGEICTKLPACTVFPRGWTNPYKRVSGILISTNRSETLCLSILSTAGMSSLASQPKKMRSAPVWSIRAILFDQWNWGLGVLICVKTDLLWTSGKDTDLSKPAPLWLKECTFAFHLRLLLWLELKHPERLPRLVQATTEPFWQERLN